MKNHYIMFANYNSWANRRLYSAVSRLSDTQYREDRGAFFGSVHGTLNHILVADMLWMHRFDGLGEMPKVLDILHEQFSALLEARKVMDARITTYFDTLDDATIAADFSFRALAKPEDITMPRAPALASFFNHQTHHRGQVHTLLTQLVGEAPSLDLIYYLWEQKSAA